MQEVHGVQHQHEVGLGKQNHDMFEVEVNDISKLSKPLHITHVYRPIFQGESKVCSFRDPKGYLRTQVLLITTCSCIRTGSSSFFNSIYIMHVYSPIFQRESKFCGFECAKVYFKHSGSH